MGEQTIDPGDLGAALEARLAAWASERAATRLWEGDHTLWTSEPQPEITDRLGWLALPNEMRAELDELTAFAEEVRAAGITDIVLLGMGGSSLAPEVFQRTFGSRAGYPHLTVLDSTHPAAVAAVHDRIDASATLFLVSSKSGTTIEPLSFMEHFWERTSAAGIPPGHHFAAVTDPGSPLAILAEERGFRRAFSATPDVGGRYSALTHFGLVPAALIGVDLKLLLDRAAVEAASAGPDADPATASAFVLGALLGEAARAGRNKATLAVSASLRAFPDWVEQLVAESTGKDATGILPVATEELGPPEVYGDDRVFISLRVRGDPDEGRGVGLDSLAADGHPVVRIELDDPAEIAAEMYRAEVAVAMAGSVLGIHPFNQPDVQRAKILAIQAMSGEAVSDGIPETSTDDAFALADDMAKLLAGAVPGSYLAIQAFLAPTAEVAERLQRIRHRVRNAHRIATTVGFGPRFLHSTGQIHKGGPAGGLFLQVVDDPHPDLPVPGSGHTFGRLIAGQADGDYRALLDARGRVVRVRVSGPAGLAAIEEAFHG